MSQQKMPRSVSFSLERLAGERRPVFRCPFHDEATASLVIDLRTRTFRCFGCDAAGNVEGEITLIRKTP